MSEPRSAASAGRGGRRGRTTRAALLAAARHVFVRTGFADANVTDVVARAGTSVGGLYHHFEGKADLYFALYEDYQARTRERTANAVAQAKQAGERDPLALFLVGTRAYFDGCWEERELALLFSPGNGPQGFDAAYRERFREWIRRNAALLAGGDEERVEALALALTAVVCEAGREIAAQPDVASAERLTEETLTLLARLSGYRPDPRRGRVAALARTVTRVTGR